MYPLVSALLYFYLRGNTSNNDIAYGEDSGVCIAAELQIQLTILPRRQTWPSRLSLSVNISLYVTGKSQKVNTRVKLKKKYFDSKRRGSKRTTALRMHGCAEWKQTS